MGQMNVKKNSMTSAAAAAVGAFSCAACAKTHTVTVLDAMLMASIFVALRTLGITLIILGLLALVLLLCGAAFRLKDTPIPA